MGLGHGRLLGSRSAKRHGCGRRQAIDPQTGCAAPLRPHRDPFKTTFVGPTGCPGQANPDGIPNRRAHTGVLYQDGSVAQR